MIKSVARAFRYTPKTLSLLNLDGICPDGLWFWYQDCIDQKRQIEKAPNVNKK